ncbi:hypothetical protein CNMCM5793_004588 [Aspergillus hiratsukae]|uniref:Uncharacterized protein n=1 Tax=Aspergillus hiratsukae TaxID=1194566 RepID=A0A8H6PG10_9EURO|nr:hypothetical protein CNMCM5793_004588 [Aspergillus hiratsukae]KAF7170018.1 hypothetical protein CNMCM6106_004879 [Aspergillus hiratsukae]
MSMSSPSIILYQGLRCTKVPRSPIAAASSSAAVPEPTPFIAVSVQGPDQVTTASPSNTETAEAVSVQSSEEVTTAPPSSTETAEAFSVQVPKPVTTTPPSSTETADAVSVQGPELVTTAPPSGTATADAVIVVAPSDALSVALPTTSSLSEAPESNTDIHRFFPSPISHNQTSGLSSTDLSTKPSSSEVLTTSTAETTFMVGTPTTTTIPAAFPSATNLSQDSPPGPEDVRNRHTLGTILGSIFGTLGFIALILLMCVLIYRYRRRKPRDGRSLGGSEKLLRSGRHSADSWASSQHAFLPRTSSLSDAPSALDHHVPGLNLGSAYAHVRKGSSLSHLSEPAPNPSDVSPDMRPHIGGAMGGTQVHSTPGDQAHEKLVSPNFQRNQDQQSIYSSERSLGSTIILPGRSSFGSSLQRASYPISISDLGPPGPNDSVTRVSTRSDPFDLEAPPNAIHRHSSGALPRG